MKQKQNNPRWRRVLLLILCAVQCMMLVSPAVPALANAPDARDYLVGTMPASEGAELGAASWLVSLSQDLAYAGIATQATIVAGEGISLIGDQKAAVINSPVKEGYFHEGGATYPLFGLQCAWKTLDTAVQDVMFYIELPESASKLRINSFTCNSWSFWVDPKGMDYQYLAREASTWVNGEITNDDTKTLVLPAGFKGYVRLKVNTAGNAAQFPAADLTVQEMTFQCDRFGGDYGAVKISGLWFVSKEDYVKIKIGDGEILEMTDPPKPVRDYLIATMPASEGAELGAASWLVSLSQDLAYAGIATQATIVAGEGISLIGDQKAAVINSPVKEGYFHEGGATYPLFGLQCAWKTLDTAVQDVMFYIELPESASKLRINSFTCNSWSFWVDPKGMDYQYLAKEASTWVNGEITNDDTKTLALPEGFKGYVRLKVNTAGNAAQFPAADLTVQEMTFQCNRFGGDYGAVKISGLWFVSKEDYVKIKIGDGEILEMTNTPDPEPTTEPTTEPDTEPGTEPDTEPDTEPGTEPDTEPDTEPNTEPAVRDYLLGAAPAQEGADIGAASSMVTINEDPAWAGISSQATMKAAEGITRIADQKATVIDSPIREGYASGDGATYPIFALDCGWGRLNTANQDIMFYIELPAASSGMRINAITCNGWSFWVSPKGMDYQYLSVDSGTWVNGKITTDNNKSLKLPEGFKGYVRLKVNTAENAAQFPDTILQVQNVAFLCERFGSDYGPIKLGGVWFVSKEAFIKIQVGEGQVLAMTDPQDPNPNPDPDPNPNPNPNPNPEDPGLDPNDPNRDYLVGEITAQETAGIGATSSMVVVSEDPAWAGIASQATIKAAAGISVIGNQKASVIDSPMSEGYFCSAGATYPLLEVNCAWKELDTATQDLMFYIELPMASSEIRFWAITCNGWTFWVSPAGMDYQYLSMDSNKWESGKISTDGNKTIALTQGFKGYVRLKVNTAENTAQFPGTKLKIQNFSFRSDIFGGDYGPVKLGGVWFVSKEDFCHISVNGAPKKVLTNYWSSNETAISQFRDLLGQMNQKDLSAAPIIDRLQSLYRSMSEEYRAMVSREELAKIEEYAAAVNAYRPAFLGVSLKKPGSQQQSLKAGWSVDEVLAKNAGYKVASCGAAVLFNRKYDGSSIIDENLADVVMVEGRTVGDVCSAAVDVDKADYQEDLLIRCYVVYENIQTGEQFAVWCGSYTDQSGQANPYLKCSLFEVANYFGVPLYAK